MEAPASHFRGGLVRGTVLPLRCPQTMSLTFWSVGGEPFELALEMVRGNARASWTRRRHSHAHSARFDVPPKDVRQLYDFLMSCSISEFVMFNDPRADNRIGCNLRVTIPVDEGNQDEVVVQLADSGTTFITDKWIPAWELLCAALKNWSDHLLTRHTTSFEVVFESALQQKCFELRLDDARALDVLEPPRRWLPEGQRVTLHGPQGLRQMKLLIDGHEYTTEVHVRLDKTFALSYDPAFQLSAFTVSEPAEEVEEAGVPTASCWQTCTAIMLCRMGERESLLEHERRLQDMQLYPPEDELAHIEPPLRVTVSVQTAGEVLPQLRESVERHIIVSVPVAPSVELSAALVEALSANKYLTYVGFLGHTPHPRDVAALIKDCHTLRSVRGVGLSQNLLSALRGDAIRELGILPQHIDRLQGASLLEQILALPSLQSVDLSGGDLGASDDLVRMLDHSLRAQNVLQLLYLRRNNLRPKAMCGILDCFNDKPNSVLRGLYLRQNSIGVESVRRIANWMLYGKAKLRYLELSLNQLGEDASYQVARILHATNRTDPLVHLDVSSNPEMPLHHIVQALLWNDTLTTLELSGNTLDRDTYKQLATALADNHTLHTLRLAAMNNMEEEEFVALLGPAMQANTGLHNLDLSANKLGARFVACMCGVLANNHTLRTLLANDNLIDSDGAVALLESATSSRDGRLRTLALRRNQLSEARVERMVQLLNARSALAKFEVAGNPVAGNRAFQQVRKTVDIT